MKSKQVLGKGLGALIPGAIDIETKKEANQDFQKDYIIAKIALDRIEPNPYQPRIDFNYQALQELADSIKQSGVIQPITVHKISHDKYQLISGERRVRAAIMAGLDLIPAYIIKIETKEELIELSLIENIQRETLNPIEIAIGFKRLIEECNLTLEDIARKTAKDKSTISNYIRLLKLPTEIQNSLIKNEITPGHARAILSVEDQEEQINLWKKIVAEKNSVREAERLAKQKKKKVKVPYAPVKITDPNLDEIISSLRLKFGTNVKMNLRNDGSGEFLIYFYSREEMERIIEILKNAKDSHYH